MLGLRVSGDHGVVQVVMIDSLFESFQHWINRFGLQANRSQFDPDDVPAYTVGFKS